MLKQMKLKMASPRKRQRPAVISFALPLIAQRKASNSTDSISPSTQSRLKSH